MEWLLLAAIVLLIAANALFVAAEFGLVTVDHTSLTQAIARGDRGARRVLAARRELSTQLSGAQLGITATSLIVGYLTEPGLAALLRGPLQDTGLTPAAAAAAAVALALLLATILQMIFGELVPKNLAIARPLPVTMAVINWQRGFTTLTRPLIHLLNGAANRLVRAVGITPREELRASHTPQELVAVVRHSAAQGTLPRPTAWLVTRSLAFGNRTAEDVMTPRPRVRFLREDQPVTAILDLARRTGHSRFPVLGEGVDDVTGLVHVKHALTVPADQRPHQRVRHVMVPPLLVPGSLELDPLLAQLRGRGLQMAVVIDEHGGTDGVVTLEDLVEELVGDISDEYDRPGRHARRRRDGSWSVSGLLRVDEVTAVTDVPLPEDPQYETLAGLVVDRLGRMARVGDRVTITTNGYEVDLTVERMDGRRIDRVGLATHPTASDPDGNA